MKTILSVSVVMVLAMLALGFGVQPAAAQGTFSAVATCTGEAQDVIFVTITETVAGGFYTVSATPVPPAPYTQITVFIGFPASGFTEGGFPFVGANGTYTITVTRLGEVPETQVFDITCPPPPPEEPEVVEPAPVPGCDTLVNLPATAVGGAFVADAPLYWAPGQLVIPPVQIPAGKTAWVLGVDASGNYRKVLWVCDFYWVPSETIGPNYDNVWQGTPLPTAVVE